MLNLTAVAAPNAAAAAEYYPAIYWWSMLKIPDASEFPGTGPQGNGIPTTMKSQAHWLAGIKTDGCVSCHQLGNKATRTIPEALGTFNSSYSAWVRRVQSGQASETMVRNHRPARHPARIQAVRRLDRPHRRRRIAEVEAAASARRRAQSWS